MIRMKGVSASTMFFWFFFLKTEDYSEPSPTRNVFLVKLHKKYFPVVPISTSLPDESGRNFVKCEVSSVGHSDFVMITNKPLPLGKVQRRRKIYFSNTEHLFFNIASLLFLKNCLCHLLKLLQAFCIQTGCWASAHSWPCWLWDSQEQPQLPHFPHVPRRCQPHARGC